MFLRPLPTLKAGQCLSLDPGTGTCKGRVKTHRTLVKCEQLKNSSIGEGPQNLWFVQPPEYHSCQGLRQNLLKDNKNIVIKQCIYMIPFWIKKIMKPFFSGSLSITTESISGGTSVWGRTVGKCLIDKVWITQFEHRNKGKTISKTSERKLS